MRTPQLLQTMAFASAAMLAAPVERKLTSPNGALTAPSGRAPREIAESFTREQKASVAGLYVHKEYKTEHNGVTHIVYRQRFQGLDIHGAEWVVNIDRDGQVLNAGGQLHDAPDAGVRPPSVLNMRRAAGAAARAVNPVLAAEATISQAGLTHRAELRFSTGGAMGDITGRPVWFSIRGALQPAWEFVVTDADGVSTYQTVIEAETERVLAKHSMTMFQSPRGLVFTGISPQPPVRFGFASLEPPPYVDREFVSFPSQWVANGETAGNNTITGLNPLGVAFLASPLTAKAANLDFQFPLVLGPNPPPPTAFTGAATTNLFYWVNRSHDLFHSLGFDEAAGNYQQYNFGRGGIEGDRLLAYVHYGAQASTGLAAINNAFYTTRSVDDGEAAMIAMYVTLNNGQFADGSLASDVIIHEYTHGVSLRLVRQLRSFQGSSMGEAFSDFFSLEFLVPEGAPPDGSYPVAEYWGRRFGQGLRTRPYSTNLEISPLTYRDLGRVTAAPEVHADGEIWVAALWDARANLIRQFGEREGRRRIRQLVIDGMKLATPAPTFVDMRDAILLADRAGFRGESQTQLWEAFAKRGLGVLAFSASADSIVVTSSSEKPSQGGVIGVGAEPHVAGDPLSIRLHDASNTADSVRVDVTSSSGDVESVTLKRDGPLFVGTLFTTPTAPARRNTGSLSIMRGDAITIYYNGAKQIEKTISTYNRYGLSVITGTQFNFPNERLLNRFDVGTGGFIRFPLPFEFPFYGKVYREVRVHPEGFVQFDASPFVPCLDQAAFSNVPAIAPLAMWMRTNGNAQPNEGIYVSTGPNSVTFRWAGETFSLGSLPPIGPAPTPVNTAVTLRENGEIRFSYGGGNTSLISGLGACPGSAPLAIISRGTGAPPVFPTAGFERANFQNAPAIEFLPPYGHSSVPEVRLSAPAANATVEGPFEVRGVVWDNDQFLSAVSIVIDGVYEGNATFSAAPAGTCTPGTRCVANTFARSFDPAALGLKPGEHTLQLRAVNGKAGFTDFPAEPLKFTVSESGGALPKAVIESPESTVVWKDGVTVQGFAYSRRSRVTAVDILIDDVAFGRAIQGLPRTDLCAGEAAGSPNCPGIGWLALIQTRTGRRIPNGEHKLQVRLTEDSGRMTLHPAEPLTIKVDNAFGERPTGVVTEPANAQKVSGTVTVRGHAWDPDGRVRNVVIAVDNIVRGTIRYGLPAPEACAQLKDVPACPNIGFEGSFDSRVLTNGAHRLGVFLTDEAGDTAYIPTLTPQGMNIIVEN